VITNLAEVRSKHRSFLAKHNSMVATEMTSAGDGAVEHVQQHPGFTRRTGELQDSTKWRLIRTAGGRVLRVQNAAKHARPIESGSRAHVIQARPGKVLRFRSGGGFVFRRKVNHPGNRAYRFLSRATNAAGQQLGKRLEVGMRVLAQGF
jgi:hypothetical protein